MQLIRRHFNTIDSTNTWAKHNIHLFPRGMVTFVTANEQTAGRGRFKRQWLSPPSQNIYASFCFFLDPPYLNIGNIPQVLAISAAKMLEELGFNPQLKWPNDVLLSKKKIGGILAETVSDSNQLCMILGIGINVNMPLDMLKSIDRPATSLLVEYGKDFVVEDVLKHLEKQFLKDLTIFLESGFHVFLSDYRRRLNVDTTSVLRVSDAGKVWEGLFLAINDDGSLSLKLVDGSTRKFSAGEILWPGE